QRTENREQTDAAVRAILAPSFDRAFQEPTMRQRGPFLLIACLLVVLLGFTRANRARGEAGGEAGFVSIFDGKTLKGWHVSAKSGHSRASNNRSGGRWVVEDGA